MHPFLTQSLAQLLFAVLCLVLAACGGTSQKKTYRYEGPTVNRDGRAVTNVGVVHGDTVVSVLWDSEDGFVRIEKIDDPSQGSNDHPVNLTAQEIRALLSPLRVEKEKGKSAPLFMSEELDKIDAPLGTALAEAEPDQDVTFAITGKRGNIGLFKQRLVTTGRVFSREDYLNVVLGIVHGEFEGQRRQLGWMRPFTPGKRKERIEKGWSIVSETPIQYASAQRQDWIRITLQDATKPTVPEQPAAAPRESEKTQTPGSTGEIEQRLETLKRLRDRGLITEDEYDQKRRAILEEL